jgi:hypothetical protein
MRHFFPYKKPVMLPDPKLAAQTWPKRVVFWALVVALAALSLDWDFNLEVPISQASCGFVGKVTKESKENQGGQHKVALASTRLHWTPSFYAYFLSVADGQSLPALALLKSALIRAPPASASF